MPELPKPWPEYPVDRDHFMNPPREFGILPFWFLNGELAPDEMRYQIAEFAAKGMPGMILHGRYGLEMPYIGEKYLDRIRFAVEEAAKAGLQTWVYDEMNWPSGTADQRVLRERPDLAQRYIECLNFTVRGPWFTYLTGADSRYNDFERSRPVAAFAISLGGGSHPAGSVIDLTPNLSFENVIPWEAPPGQWRLMYIVEKRADYYIDALDPEATREFLRVGYEPYAQILGENLSGKMLGFYTDEPAMHYYVTGSDNPILPWTKDMFQRFQQRNGYNLRPRLPDLFFDIGEDSARVRYDFYNTTTEFYSQAYYQQIHDWCEAHGALFTGHLLYEEWLRRLVRVEGNLFKHYPHLHVIGVDHLYPITGNRDRPDEHVAMKVGSSAAHQLRSPRLLCESFGGIFMDATMQRMKWIADWEYVLGVNLLNPHGFHYTLEGPRKRDWPPSMFYQYPWWQFYGKFSEYVGRLSHMLSGGKHVAKVAVLWPLNALYAGFTPQSDNPLSDRLVQDFNALTDLLLRVHYDFDYLDEDILCDGELDGGALRVADEAYQVIILPPITHLKLETLEKLEQFVSNGGRVLGTVFLPTRAYGERGLVDISQRIARLFGVDPTETQRDYAQLTGIDFVGCDHPLGGKTGFLRSYALARGLPLRIQRERGTAQGNQLIIETDQDASHYYYQAPSGERVDITDEVNAGRQAVATALEDALNRLIEPDVVIDNPEIFYLHRVKDGQDIYFFTNGTFSAQTARVTLRTDRAPFIWDPSDGCQRPAAPVAFGDGKASFELQLPPTGSTFVVPGPQDAPRIVDTNLTIDHAGQGEIRGYGSGPDGYVVIERGGQRERVEAQAHGVAGAITLEGPWELIPEDDNALVIGRWMVKEEIGPAGEMDYLLASPETGEGWQAMVPGAWSYQLPGEPALPYPRPVWYRASFNAISAPEKLSLIIDGFAGSEWRLYINGKVVETPAERSAIDSQMQAVEITPYVQEGENQIAIRLVVMGPTGGLLDLIKLAGSFRLEAEPQGAYSLASPRTNCIPADWTSQGYPFYSGIGVYRCRFTLPDGFTGQRLFLSPRLYDDAVEVIVNGECAGARIWAPYEIEVTGQLHPGENLVELRVANTLVNLLEGVERPSGLSGAPDLVARPGFRFHIAE